MCVKETAFVGGGLGLVCLGLKRTCVLQNNNLVPHLPKIHIQEDLCQSLCYSQLKILQPFPFFVESHISLHFVH